MVSVNNGFAMEKPLANRTNGKSVESWRDEKGRFVKGNPGGPGNPYSKQIAEFRRAIYRALTPEDIEAFVKRMYDLALQGNVVAIQFICRYCLGEPKGMEFNPRAIDEIEQIDNEWTEEAEERARGRLTEREMWQAFERSIQGLASLVNSTHKP